MIALEKKTLSSDEKLAWLRLIRSENVGPKTFFQLLKLYGTAEKALDAMPAMSQRGGKSKAIRLYSTEQAEQEMEACERLGTQVIAYAEPDYPPLLRHIPDPPPVITVLGDPTLFQSRMVALVGARHASANGCRIAYHLAEALGNHDIIPVSGLARGIDTAAHKGAQDGKTVAVVAGGIDHIYPQENNELYHHIAEHGAIIAECALATIPRHENFPRRNRIISGISAGVVVVEAATRSGSLITARFAAEQGREVMAVPGFPMDPRAEGPNRLIKQGASLVEKVEDILETLNHAGQQTMAGLFDDTEPFEYEEIIEYSEQDQEQLRDVLTQQLSNAPLEIDMLAQSCNAQVKDILPILLELELAGKLSRHPGNKVALLAAA